MKMKMQKKNSNKKTALNIKKEKNNLNENKKIMFNITQEIIIKMSANFKGDNKKDTTRYCNKSLSLLLFFLLLLIRQLD